MLFRPKFCSQCGEKIERTEWRLWTSRRFCDLCATDHRVTEFGPLAFGLLGLVAVVAAGSNFSGGESAKTAKSLTSGPEIRSFAPAPKNENSTEKPAAQPAASEAPHAVPTIKPPVQQVPVVAASVYMCGAETKKGTPCSRRVKTNARCFQHTGMPAMVPNEKLKIG